MQRVAVIGSASGVGKTTFAQALAERLEAPYVELDALNHRPGWTEAPDEELRASVEPLAAQARWVIDGTYVSKLGTLVLDAADTIVWLDPPVRVWLPRLLRRTIRRIVTREELWSGNRETFRGAFVGREALIPFSLLHYRRRRREYPARLAPYRHFRLRSQREMDGFLSGVVPADLHPARIAPSRQASDPPHEHR